MKKILIISYFFPPCNLTASQRVSSWAKYLNKSGYYFLDIPKEKSFSNRLAGTIPISDTSKLDIHQINVDFLMNDYQYYLVTNWNTLLVLKSIDHLKKEMK